MLRRLSFVLKPLHRWYSSGTRHLKLNGMRLQVNPGVFHPGLFFSSRAMGEFLNTLDLKNKTLLDLGCGSGFLALYSAKLGAKTTGVDRNPAAVQNTAYNASQNRIDVDVLESNLFSALNDQKFDFIVVNPPFFPKNPESDADLAWFAGENLAYFRQLFSQLPHHLSGGGKCYMVLSGRAPVDQIILLANHHDLSMTMVAEKHHLFEKSWIYRIEA